MKVAYTIMITISCFLLLTCSKEEIRQNTYPDNYYTQLYGNPQIKDKVYEKNGRTYLWAGADSSTHFDITGWLLKTDNLHFGLGREHFKALIEPVYIPVDDENIDLIDGEKCLFVKGENDLIKVYPYKYMLEYEVVNDRIDGKPIMVAYCVLADLSAAYTRVYCEKEITFGVSGYTYSDPQVWGGLDGFVLWDRDTESLWWPLIDKGVSGSMTNVILEKHDETDWDYITWGDVKTEFPNALVIKPGQTQETPENWPNIPESELNCN